MCEDDSEEKHDLLRAFCPQMRALGSSADLSIPGLSSVEYMRVATYQPCYQYRYLFQTS